MMFLKMQESTLYHKGEFINEWTEIPIQPTTIFHKHQSVSIIITDEGVKALFYRKIKQVKVLINAFILKPTLMYKFSCNKVGVFKDPTDYNLLDTLRYLKVGGGRITFVKNYSTIYDKVYLTKKEKRAKDHTLPRELYDKMLAEGIVYWVRPSDNTGFIFADGNLDKSQVLKLIEEKL